MHKPLWIGLLPLTLVLIGLSGHLVAARAGHRARPNPPDVTTPGPAPGIPTPLPQAPPGSPSGGRTLLGSAAPADCPWTTVASPALPASQSAFYGLAALATNDLWAVGRSDTPSLIEHWDGTAWTQSPSPSPGTTVNALQAIAAVSADDIWAVGTYYQNGPNHALIEHWNGQQ